MGEFLAEAGFRDAFFEEAVFDKPLSEFLVVEVMFGEKLGDDFFDVVVGIVGVFLEAFETKVVASFFDGVRAH